MFWTAFVFSCRSYLSPYNPCSSSYMFVCFYSSEQLMILLIQPVECTQTISLPLSLFVPFTLFVYLQYPGELYIAPNRVCNLIWIVFQSHISLSVQLRSVDLLFLFFSLFYSSETKRTIHRQRTICNGLVSWTSQECVYFILFFKGNV